VTESALQSISGAALNNLRLAPKIAVLLHERQGIDLAIVPTLFIPTGPNSRYVGDSTVVVAPSIVLSRPIGNFRPVINLTATLRPEPVSFVNETIGSELSARLGLAYRFNQIHPNALPLELGATLTGSTPMRDPFAQFNEQSLEVKAYAGYTLWRWLNVFAGGGAGLAKGWGTPDWRVFAGLRVGQWDENPAPKKEVVATRPPEPDTDGDGILDVADACPKAPGPAANHGCPDTDKDADGIPDRLDACPEQPEDKDGWQDEDGCPDPDNDADGVLDAADPCPLDPGPVENRGCPDTDRDHDGIVDRLDDCPDEPGTEQFHGCKKKQLAVLQADRIVILDAVHFDTGKAVIQKRSFAVLDNVTQILESHPELASVRIEGHTDSHGNDAANLRLSQHRADAVREYLIRHGILAVRLRSIGFGETHPIADNKTAKGRAINRRVEFKIEPQKFTGTSTQPSDGKGQ
jgi:outer membrane protein OmpA-like peptidoglycan-associated protein